MKISRSYFFATLDKLVFFGLFCIYPWLIAILSSGRMILILLGAISLFSFFYSPPSYRRLLSPTMILMLLALVYIALNAIFSGNSTAIQSAVKNIAMLFAAHSAARYQFHNLSRLQRNVSIVLVSFMGIFLLFFLKYGSVRAATYLSDYSVSSFSNWVPAMVIPLATMTFFQKSRQGRYRVLSFGLFAAIVIMSQSRFAYVIGAGLFGLLILPLNIKGILRAVGAVLVVFVILQIPASKTFVEENAANVVERLSRIPVVGTFFGGAAASLAISSAQTSYETSIREQMEKKALEVWRDGPVFGAGYYFFSRTDSIEIHGKSVISHNLYLVTGLGELGGLGFLLIVAYTLTAIFGMARMWWKMFVRSNPSQRFYFGLLLALLIVAAHAYVRPQFDNPVYYMIIVFSGWMGTYRGAPVLTQPREAALRRQAQLL